MPSYPLVLHPKWEKSISKKDLMLFRSIAAGIKDYGDSSSRIEFINAKVARNYRGDILATVLIKNNTLDPFILEEKQITYMEKGIQVATKPFTINSLKVEPYTITPWTFLFEPEFFIGEPAFEGWALMAITDV